MKRSKLDRKCPNCGNRIDLALVDDIWIDSIGLWYTCKARRTPFSRICDSTMLVARTNWRELLDEILDRAHVPAPDEAQ